MLNTKIITTALTLIISGTMAFAQEGKTNEEKKQSSEDKTVPTSIGMQNDSVYYTCSMHPDVTMDKPGKCPKCEMTLEKKTMKMTETKGEKKEALKTYTCSMHPDVRTNKPGKCPKCGMTLEKVKK